jgi:hypothetical protein
LVTAGRAATVLRIDPGVPLDDAGLGEDALDVGVTELGAADVASDELDEPGAELDEPEAT